MHYCIIISFILLHLLSLYGIKTLQDVNKVSMLYNGNMTTNTSNTGPVNGLPIDTTVICSSDNPVTHTSVGIYCGLREIVHWPNGPASVVDVYYGIRYAQSPTGSLRFRKPVEPKPEPKKVFMADKLPATCPQPKDTMFQNSAAARMWVPNTPMSEDCLFLNIWVPSQQSNDNHSNSKENLQLCYGYTVEAFTWVHLH
ncbi:unnamed protein product [Heterobilharzia americana]|nr:unnamed protein product [Heterobilharzia americana]